MAATTYTSGVWEYQITGQGEITITGNTATTPTYGVSIPSTLDGYKVVAIGNGAFSDMKNLVGVGIPDSVVSIGHGAFTNCTNLYYITIPKSVKSMGYSVFNGCTNMACITIYGNPSLLDSALGTDAKEIKCYSTASNVINYCRLRTYLNLSLIDASVADTTPDTFTYQDEYGTWTYNVADEEITKYEGTAETVYVPEYVKYGDKSFPVIRIGSHAFDEATMKYLYIYNTQTKIIGTEAFYNCTQLTQVFLSEHVQLLLPYSFWFCDNLAVLYVPGNTIFTPSCVKQDVYVRCNQYSISARYYCYVNNMRQACELDSCDIGILTQNSCDLKNYVSERKRLLGDMGDQSRYKYLDALFEKFKEYMNSSGKENELEWFNDNGYMKLL